MRLDFDEVGVSGLAKAYGPTLALAGVDIRFAAGTVTVLRGANGSGKSTLLWLLALLGHPTRGTLRYGRFGRDRADDLRGNIGFVAHRLQLYPGLSGQENLVLAANLHGVADADRRARTLAATLSVTEYWDRPLRTYSRGQAQRISIARALLHEPRLLLMDEPATGLDTASTEAVVGLIEREKRRGAIVVVVTHEVKLAEAIGSRVLYMSRGRLVEAAE